MTQEGFGAITKVGVLQFFAHFVSCKLLRSIYIYIFIEKVDWWMAITCSVDLSRILLG